MTIEEEIAPTFGGMKTSEQVADEALSRSFDPSGGWREIVIAAIEADRAQRESAQQIMEAAAVLMPLLNRVRAEALREVATVIDSFSGTCLNASGAADIIMATANHFEKSSHDDKLDLGTSARSMV